jgi:ribosome-binding factor A
VSRRLLKAAAAIREVVSMAILTELRDPRVKMVTVVGVDVAPDMKSAKVQVSIMGDEKEQRLALSGLQHSAGFLQRKIADRIDTRYTPRLTFVMDKGVKNSLEVLRILKEVLPPGAGQEASQVDADQADAREPESDLPEDALPENSLPEDVANEAPADELPSPSTDESDPR